MKFEETPLRGAYLIDLQPVEDARGYFARAFCRREICGFFRSSCAAKQRKRQNGGQDCALHTVYYNV